MNKLIHTLQMALLAMLMGMTAACTPDSYDLEAPDVASEDLVEGIAYTITHDSENPNIIYLKSLMPSSYQVCWEHPQGRAQGAEVTLQIPFEGEYEVTFGVQTRGGVVYGKPSTFTVDDFYAGFVNDEMWTLVSGGVGNSKTWYLDLDADGVSRYFLGPIYFFTVGYCWDNLHASNGTNYLDTDGWDPTSAIVPNVGEDGSATWYWLSDWAGNSWICDAADFGTMTFDLNGNANVVTDQEAYGLGTQKGLYMIDTDNHTMTFTDAWPVHDKNRDGHYIGRTFEILYLSEDFMQLAIQVDNDGSLICYNYISEDYRNNWVPDEGGEEAEEPTLPDGWKDAVSEIKTTEIIWSMSADVPFDWATLNGSLMNNFTAGNYPDWATPADNLDKLTMTLNSADNSYEFEMPDGTTVSGTYTLDDKGIYTFNNGIPDYGIGADGGIMFGGSDTNQLRILQVNMIGDTVEDMWLGRPNPDKPESEYQAYHFIPNGGESGGVQAGTVVPFDNNKLLAGDLETNGNYRLEIFNDWGGNITDAANCGLTDVAGFTFSSRLYVNFTLSGVGSLSTPCTAKLTFSDGTTNVQYWGEGDGGNKGIGTSVDVIGDGTYTVSLTPPAGVTSTGLHVFCIDIVGMTTVLGGDASGVTAAINSIVVDGANVVE